LVGAAFCGDGFSNINVNLCCQRNFVSCFYTTAAQEIFTGYTENAIDNEIGFREIERNFREDQKIISIISSQDHFCQNNRKMMKS
jgi:hypothetical protein